MVCARISDKSGDRFEQSNKWTTFVVVQNFTPVNVLASGHFASLDAQPTRRDGFLRSRSHSVVDRVDLVVRHRVRRSDHHHHLEAE